MKRVLLAVLLSLLALGMTAEPVEGAERPQIEAVRAGGPIRVDGRMDETDWERAPPITAFRLILVREGEAPSESTEVRVLHDDSHLYFGIRCANRSPGAVRASLTPRDQILDGDHISIHLDTYRDFHRAYIFGVNPYGVQLDGILDGDEPDFNWDSVWDAESTRDAEGWASEIAVPLQALRFPQSGDGRWGLWIRREITKNDEVCTWPLYREGVQGDIMLQAGDLGGLASLRGGGGLELQPYVSSTNFASRTFDANEDASDWNDRTEADVGLDVKYGLTATMALDGTLNPDFSQIEADALQIDVNRRFPLFFPEKRTFFLEGSEIFATPYNLVYTRRIADPAFGGKLTGKAGRWRLGAIAVRDDGGSSIDGVGGRAFGDGLTQGWFSIGRARYDIGENSNVGLLITDHRSDRESLASDTGGIIQRVPNGAQNTVVAADTRLRLSRSFFFSGQIGGSWTRVDSTAVSGAVRDVREQFSDALYTTNAWYQDGTSYVLGYHDYLGPDFRTESGFLDRVDARTSAFEGHVTMRPKRGPLRTWQPQSNGNVIHDARGILQERRLAGAVEWSFHKQTRLHTRFAHVIERWRSREYDRNRYILELENTLWRPLGMSFFATLEDGIFYAPTDSASFLGWQESYQLIGTIRPDPRLTSEVTATRNRFSRSYGGAEVYDILVVGAKTTYQFTRRLFARLYPQYDTDADHLDVDALLAYVIHPGSVLYVGVNGDLDRMGDRHRATGRTVFLKASYLFQP